MNRLWKFFTSLRLTVTLLSFGILLVFIALVALSDRLSAALRRGLG